MRDSRASLRQNGISLSQNETIQRLTYLTIAYLPITLMAVSLFSSGLGTRALHLLTF